MPAATRVTQHRTRGASARPLRATQLNTTPLASSFDPPPPNVTVVALQLNLSGESSTEPEGWDKRLARPAQPASRQGFSRAPSTEMLETSLDLEALLFKLATRAG